MTTQTLYDALETCLQALEQGADVESCLARFPAQAEELRPLLGAAVEARASAVAEVPEAVLRRGKARLLQAAAELREQASSPAPRRAWQFGRMFRLGLASLVVLFFLLGAGSAGMVLAASGSLPGDGLYPVKRGWEGARLFVAAPAIRAELETEFEQERVREIEALYRAGRAEQVNFEGLVMAQNATLWNISGLLVIVTDQTQLEGEIVPGARVQAWGRTGAGRINAERIILLTAPIVTQPPLPPPTLQPAFTLTPGLTATKEAPSPTVTIQPTLPPPPAPTATPRKPFPTQPPASNDNGNGNDNGSNDNDNRNDNDDGNNNGNDNDNG